MKTVEFMGMTLMLDTKAKIQLEDKIGSPLKYVFGLMGEAMTEEEEMDITKFELPPLKVMILTIHASAQKLNANVSVEKVMDKVDEFLEEKSVIELFTVFMELLKIGRYLPEEQE
jgi:hypothetical protein